MLSPTSTIEVCPSTRYPASAMIPIAAAVRRKPTKILRIAVKIFRSGSRYLKAVLNTGTRIEQVLAPCAAEARFAEMHSLLR